MECLARPCGALHIILTADATVIMNTATNSRSQVRDSHPGDTLDVSWGPSDIIPFEELITTEAVRWAHKPQHVIRVCDQPRAALLEQKVRSVARGAGDWAANCSDYAAKPFGLLRGTYRARTCACLDNDDGT